MSVTKEYACCGKCRKSFEYVHESMNDKLTECPVCKGKVERILAPVYFRISGYAAVNSYGLKDVNKK